MKIGNIAQVIATNSTAEKGVQPSKETLCERLGVSPVELKPVNHQLTVIFG